jgi:hypothetical protein
MKACKWLYLTGETLKFALGDPELVLEGDIIANVEEQTQKNFGAFTMVTSVGAGSLHRPLASSLHLVMKLGRCEKGSDESGSDLYECEI